MATAPSPAPAAKPTLTTDAEEIAAKVENALSRAHMNGWVFAIALVIANVVGVLLHV